MEEDMQTALYTYLRDTRNSNGYLRAILVRKHPPNHTPTHFAPCALVYGAGYRVGEPETTVSDYRRGEEAQDRVML